MGDVSLCTEAQGRRSSQVVTLCNRNPQISLNDGEVRHPTICITSNLSLSLSLSTTHTHCGLTNISVSDAKYSSLLFNK